MSKETDKIKKQRIERARLAFKVFQQQDFSDAEYQDLITDILHLVNANALEPTAILRMAIENFNCETEDSQVMREKL